MSFIINTVLLEVYSDRLVQVEAGLTLTKKLLLNINREQRLCLGC